MYDKRIWINRTIELLEKNQDKIDWNSLSLNPNAIDLLEKNPDKIYWKYLSNNPNAIDLLEKNQDKKMNYIYINFISQIYHHNQDPNNILIFLDDKPLSLNLLL